MFTERPKPSHIIRYPSIQSGLAFAGHQRPSQLPGPSAAYRVGSLAGASKPVERVRPDSSAASMVNSLNVEPAWYPSTLAPPEINGLTVFGWFACPAGLSARL